MYGNDDSTPKSGNMYMRYEEEYKNSKQNPNDPVIAGNKVIIIDTKLSDAIRFAKILEKGVTDSLKQAKDLKTKIDGGKWSGKTRDAFLCYLELILQLHEDVEQAMKDHTSALNHLHQSMIDILSNSEITALNRL
ncbi:WXG100 family type VII secretion target [Bacillus sp. WMMC1349]|uniref:WXG100 family type VII secretion target n=1 Tax=Bacillus sp. WMMC1349 TaxID=2736254 RepID=UPI0020A66B23|nr:WXG100 family type VII secretion target [Bacillus sp. WMMC1349]